MRILVVNPNTTASMTAKIEAAARAAAGPGTEVRAVNPTMGPASIEGYYDEALSVPGLLECVAGGERQGFDGYVVACFDDTGLDAARCLAAGPVAGICEAAVRFACLVAGRFSVVTTLSRSVPPLEGLARRYGVGDRCTVRAAEVAVLDLEDPGSRAASRVREEVLRARDEDRAEAIVLGCAGMADLASRLAAEVGLPVVEGVGAATRLVESALALGLRTGKTGGYAAPRPKTYRGDLARFAPPGAAPEGAASEEDDDGR